MKRLINPDQFKSMIDCKTKHIKPIVFVCSVLLLTLANSLSYGQAYGQALTQAELDEMSASLKARISIINIGIKNAPGQCPSVKRTFIAMRDWFECSLAKVKIYKSAASGYGQTECDEKVETLDSLQEEFDSEISSKSTCNDYYNKVNELLVRGKVGGN